MTPPGSVSSILRNSALLRGYVSQIEQALGVYGTPISALDEDDLRYVLAVEAKWRASLEMAYDNVQDKAKAALAGYRRKYRAKRKSRTHDPS